MSEPHNPRGGVPDPGVADASPGPVSGSQPPARAVAGDDDEEGNEEAPEQPQEPAWPVRDPEAPVEWPKDPSERNGFDQDTDRISRDSGPGASAPGVSSWPASGAADAEQPTMKFRPASPPESVPAEEPTRQFRRPDLSGPPPKEQRTAQPADFTTVPQPGQGPGPPRAPEPRYAPWSRPEPTPHAEQPHPEQSRPEQFDPEQLDPGSASPETESPGHREDPVPDMPEQDASPAAEPATSAPAVPLYRRRRVLVTVSLVAVVLLAAGVVFGRSLLFGDGEPPRAEPPSPVRLRPAFEPLGGSGAAPSKQQVAAALEPAVSDPALGTFGGIVLDPVTGRTLWKHNAQQGFVPASTAKLLTVSAALLTLGHRHRFTTKVVQGAEPGSVVLVGGGDPTLSSLPEEANSVYPGAAHLDTLVAEVRKATGGEVSSITVDTSRYTGPDLAPGWLPADVGNGYIAPIEPVMLDGGRADPTRGVSPRSSQPALDAGRELARRLGVPTSDVDIGEAPQGAPVLGEVKSAPLQQMVRTVLRHSDNVLAETLAREVAIATDHEPSFAGATAAVRAVLTRNGFDLTGTRMVDGSGLSTDDRVTARALGSLLVSASAPAGADGALPRKTAKLRALLTALPVAGGSGSLEDRYREAASNGRGWVRAKTGTLTDVNSLAGTIVTRDGSLLVFAVISNGTSSIVARPALDKVASALRTCGCRE
ncbi:D-alanyl-D-alanine carboxypeptidase/D-alanyl-D-alanine endopeptidase [Haloactinomyces albus]|uniref:D-alanyl-D-alanine carboxypeptidase/D-alanyl-D-alanine-endopeptidase (Penicillin-binding protein 4) n=1 Tax=Haloactinomyces albus TaxID=1352928 RepID=A0AAE3ZDS2_9ACTN|nr:D-alanyl-D-alanine carboxypeptidase/D-alanyl-D-alanine-endopeptidase [Haloactinomyces albus]MDR7301699.1 D-alanyl-D-alanine carboxypeptidase/D-alanyl-D-alanine-endopeptidase (penicillin-binding protein 4) [Haloactinomyces albus]